MKNCLLTLLLSLGVMASQAQKESFTWYFGNKAGITFNGPTPSPLVDSDMNTSEGVASISDSLGNILFYTDGSSIWDSTDNKMPGGTFLSGNLSTSQSALILPQPCAGDSMYYVFTLGKETGALYHSTVNMRANGGLGAVAQKNKLMLLEAPEKLTAIQHKNGVDFWVIAHGWNNTTFHAFLLSNLGLADAVTSDAGSIHTGTIYESIGVMKPSHDGTKVAVALRKAGASGAAIEIVDFDNETGMFSNAITLTGVGTPYGLEFSPDNTKLYATIGVAPSNQLKQFDLSAGTAAAIKASAYSVAQISGVLNNFGQLQLAPDGRIYAAITNRDYLSTINNPDVKGAGCTWSEDAFHLGGKRSKLGLPNIPQGVLFSKSLSVTGELDVCKGGYVQLSVAGDETYEWFTEDEPSIVISTDETFQVSPDTTTTYIARGGHGCPVSHTVNVHENVEVDLGLDTVICNFSQHTIDAGSDGSDYLWSNGETTQTILIDKGGSYWVEVSAGNCSDKDTVIVDASFPIAINVSNTTVDGCDRIGGNSGSATVEPSGGIAPYTFEWNTTPVQTSASANGLSAGVYEVTVTDSKGCSSIQQVVIEERIQLETNVIIVPSCPTCTDGSASVTVSGTGKEPYTYRWDDPNDQTTATATGLANGIYIVVVTDADGCFNVDTIQVGIVGIEDLGYNQLEVFPNPSTGKVFLKNMVFDSNPVTLEVFDASGKLVSGRRLSNTEGNSLEIKIEDPGIYYIRTLSQQRVMMSGRILITN